jgi:hypothetical protein
MLLDTHALSFPDGYPEEETLERIARWRRAQGFENLLLGIIPAFENMGIYCAFYHNKHLQYNLSTGGWSGNEQIIRALELNKKFWSSCWLQSKRGGHFQFTVKKDLTCVDDGELLRILKTSLVLANTDYFYQALCDACFTNKPLSQNYVVDHIVCDVSCTHYTQAIETLRQWQIDPTWNDISIKHFKQLIL